MPSKYQTVTKRVSFDDSARFNFEAPRSSLDARPNMESPYHTPESHREDSEDEIDTLLATDPMSTEKEGAGKSRARGSSRISRKKRRILIFGLVTLTLGVLAALGVVGLQLHTRNKQAVSQGSTTPHKVDDKAAMAEVADLTEVPSLAGMLPLDAVPTAISPVPVQEEKAEGELDQIVSVPSTDIDYSNEAADKAAYEAEAAKDNANVIDDPPTLSAEAIAQAQDVNTQLDEASASVAATADQIDASTAESESDYLQAMQDAADDFWAWLDATWSGMVGNDPSSGEPVY